MTRFAIAASVSCAILLGAEDKSTLQNLAGSNCSQAVVQQIPGQFLPTPRPQVLTIERAMKDFGHGLVCGYRVGISDRTLRTEVRYFWEGSGPGLVFSDSHWHPADYTATLDIQVVHLDGFRHDQVFVAQTVTKGLTAETRIRMYAFSGEGKPVPLISIRGPHTLYAEIGSATITVGDEREKVTLQFDRESQAMSILDPTPASVRFYKLLQEAY